MSDLVGRRLGDYQILRRLGSGGMAEVYAARQLTLHRDVALKVLRSVMREDDDSLKRFRREAQAAARLNHPCIVQIYDFGEVEGVHYIAQELVDGINLKEALDREGPLSAAQAVTVLQSVGGALQTAHQSGVTHRDIKPENIMRGSNGEFKVTDFGLARMLTQIDSSTANLTRAGLTLGTPRYMSPEQIQGKNVDARSDLYSLGVTMYHLLTGSPPYEADEPLALAIKHLHETPQPIDHVRGTADLPAWLVSLVMQLLQKDPDERLRSAADLLRVVENHVPHDPRSASRDLSHGDPAPSQPSGKHFELISGEHRSSRALAEHPGSAVAAPTSDELGVSSATLELQRVTDAMRVQRSGRARRMRMFQIGVALACLLGGIGAIAAAKWSQPPSISHELRGPLVAKADSIEQQYLIALTRDDVPAWRAVLAYPLSSDSPQSEYRAKSLLQLARLLIQQHDYAAATETLDELQQSKSVKRLYTILALVHRHTIAIATENIDEASRLKTQISDNLQELAADNPAALEMFRRVVPKSERLTLGLVE